MGRRLVGSLMFLGVAMGLFENAGRLASERREGWGWFLLVGLILSGIALNLWNGDAEVPQATVGLKPQPIDDF